MRTVIYPSPDLEQGKAFYAAVLGVDPYFDEPFYVGFEVGGFELGLVPDASPGDAGAKAYWGVDNAEEELARLTALGAVCVEPVTDVGGGIKVAAIADPFGNCFGIIENPMFNVANVR